MEAIVAEVLNEIEKIKDLKQSRPLSTEEIYTLLIASLLEEENS